MYLIYLMELRYFFQSGLSFLVSSIENKSMARTTFKARYGHYEFLIMHFGFRNVLIAFMDSMTKVFKEYLHRFILLVIDGIFEYLESLEEHKQHLRVVLHNLNEKKLFAKFSK